MDRGCPPNARPDTTAEENAARGEPAEDGPGVPVAILEPTVRAER
jgi:hypothetical protein